MRARRLVLLFACLAAANSAAAESVTVRAGDSLWAVAQRHDTTTEALMSANGLTTTTVNPGAVLELPAGVSTAPEAWTVAVGDTLYEIATASGISVDDLTAWNALAGSAIQPGQELQLAAGPTVPAPLEIAVGPGDTLWRIAHAHDTTPAALAAANGIDEGAILNLGDTLIVPGVLAATDTPDQGGYAAPTITVDPGDTLWEIARRYDTTVIALMAANSLPAETLQAGQELRIVTAVELRSIAAVPAPGPTPTPYPTPSPTPSPTPDSSGQMAWPLHGELTSYFGWRQLQIGGSNMHYGVDIDGNTGDPIVAATGGTVTFAGWMGGFGQLVVIEHTGAEYYYAHASELNVSEGQIVQAGQLIARVGTTGRVTGSHLHFEIRVDGSPIDPLPFLETRTAAR